MIDDAVRQLESQWSGERWSGIERTYTAEQVVKLRGSVVPEHTLARLGAERLWELLQREAPVPSGSRVRGTFRVDGVREEDWGRETTMTATIECDGVEKPVCVAEVVYRYYTL